MCTQWPLKQILMNQTVDLVMLRLTFMLSSTIQCVFCFTHELLYFQRFHWNSMPEICLVFFLFFFFYGDEYRKSIHLQFKYK